jgi:CRP-like cAMP-binding protein
MIAQSSVANDPLTRLDGAAYGELMTRAVEQPLVNGFNLAMAGEQIEFCWFPTSGLISIIALDADGDEAEVGMIGREGIVNLPVVLGDDCSALRVMVQVGGSAIRVEANAVRAVSPTIARPGRYSSPAPRFSPFRWRHRRSPMRAMPSTSASPGGS